MSAPAITPQDVRRWQGLIIAANAAVERPADATKAREFKHYADLCFHRATLPDQDKRKAAPFMALTGFGRAWCAMTTLGRRDNADAVLAAIEGCEAQLAPSAPPSDPPEDPPPAGWQARVDING